MLIAGISVCKSYLLNKTIDPYSLLDIGLEIIVYITKKVSFVFQKKDIVPIESYINVLLKAGEYHMRGLEAMKHRFCIRFLKFPLLQIRN